MQHYTVTITPDDGEGAQTVVRLEVKGNVPQIKELRLIAGRNGSLSTAQLPAINLEMLLAAVLPAARTTPSIRPATTPAAARVTPPPAEIEAEPVAAGPATTAPPATSATPKSPAAKTAPAKTTPRPKKESAKATTTKAATATKAPAKAATKAATAKAAKPAPEGSGSKDRAYRSMPEDFVSTYHQAPTVAALAEVYGVPVYTAQNWINTARKRDMIPPARSRKR